MPVQRVSKNIYYLNFLFLYEKISQGNNQIIKIKFARLIGSFAGTGDAFAAMVLAWLTILKDLKVYSFKLLKKYKIF